MDFRSLYAHGPRPRRGLHDPHRDRRPAGQRRGGAAARARLRRGRRRGRGLPGAVPVRLLHRGPPAPGRPAGRGRGRRCRRSSPAPPTCCPCSCSARRCATAAGSTTARSSCTAAGSWASSPSPTCRPTASSTSAASSPRATTQRGDDPRRRRRRPLRPRRALRGRRRAGPGRARRGLRGHVGPDPAVGRGRAGGRHRPAQPLRQPDHRRPRRGPQALRALGLVALPGRLRLRRGRPGRVDHRPLVGRPDHGLRERRAARRDGPLPRRRPARRRRRRPRPAAPGAPAHGDLRRQPPRPRRPRRRVPPRVLHARAARPRPRPAPRRRALPVRALRPRPARARLLRGLQHPGRGPPAAAAGDRRPEGRHRRVGRPGLDPRADRRRAGDGPLRAARAATSSPSRCPGFATSSGTKDNAHELDALPRRHGDRARHPPDGAS